MRVLAVTNPKGGVGKTTIAVGLAARFAARGVRVLLVDTDTQGHAALFLGGKPAPGFKRLLMETGPVGDLVLPAVRPNLDVLPGDPSTGAAARALNGELGVHKLVRRRLGEARDDYQVCIIDTSPSVDLVSSMALYAADGVLVPVTPGYAPESAVGSLRRRLASMEDSVDYAPKIAGVFPNMLQPRTVESRNLLSFLTSANLPTGPSVQRHEVLNQAPRAGRTIEEFAPTSRAAQEIDDLARWTAGRLGEL